MVIKFNPMNFWYRSDYFGASIQSYHELGRKKGYDLVCCESSGINLFFVDHQYLERFASNGRGHRISDADLV
jgi:hypothetical protein